MSLSRIALLLVVGFIVLMVVWSGFRNGVTQGLTRLMGGSETITVTSTTSDGSGGLTQEEQELELITLLGFDAIPAILDPDFVDVETADDWMRPDELVLGLSINGDNRAYSIPMLSAHEIVNDTVGGEHVAVTW